MQHPVVELHDFEAAAIKSARQLMAESFATQMEQELTRMKAIARGLRCSRGSTKMATTLTKLSLAP